MVPSALLIMKRCSDKAAVLAVAFSYCSWQELPVFGPAQVKYVHQFLPMGSAMLRTGRDSGARLSTEVI